MLDDRATTESADYAEKHMASAIGFHDRARLWDFCLGKVGVIGIYAEFGVWRGSSIDYFARRLPKETTIYGFDSFEGLQNNWAGAGLLRGGFSVGGRLPKVRGNVVLIKGWFEDTLPKFLHENPGNFAFLHVDCDTYESARTVLTLLADRLVAGTVIIFDEYFGYRGWRLGEWKAWQEICNERKIRYEYMGFAGFYQVAVRIL